MAKEKAQTQEPRRTHVVEIMQMVADDAKAGKAYEVIEADKELNAKEAEASVRRKEINAELKEARAYRNKLLEVVESGVERVNVEVYTKIDEQRMEVLSYRADNDDPLPELTRPMTPDERQMNLEELLDLPPGEDPRVAAADSGEDQDDDGDDEDDDLPW